MTKGKGDTSFMHSAHEDLRGVNLNGKQTKSKKHCLVAMGIKKKKRTPPPEVVFIGTAIGQTNRNCSTNRLHNKHKETMRGKAKYKRVEKSLNVL